jgi:hypothetical protein
MCLRHLFRVRLIILSLCEAGLHLDAEGVCKLTEIRVGRLNGCDKIINFANVSAKAVEALHCFRECLLGDSWSVV